MTNNWLKNDYKVRWDSDVFGVYKNESIFHYNGKEPLKYTFKRICNMIIEHILIKGNLATVEDESAVDNGITIAERLPGGVIIKLHWVWIDKA